MSNLILTELSDSKELKNFQKAKWWNNCKMKESLENFYFQILMLKLTDIKLVEYFIAAGTFTNFSELLQIKSD